MKKPIKFRGKCLKTKKWVFGYYGKYNLTRGEVRHGIIEADKPVNVVTIDLNTLGQLVTIQDGKEIYEGDLVEENYMDEGENHTSLFPIVWDAANLYWAVDTGFYKKGFNLVSISDWYGTALMKINGNIHDQKIII